MFLHSTHHKWPTHRLQVVVGLGHGELRKAETNGDSLRMSRANIISTLAHLEWQKACDDRERMLNNFLRQWEPLMQVELGHGLLLCCQNLPQADYLNQCIAALKIPLTCFPFQ